MSKLIKSTLENLCLLVTDGTHDSPKLQDSGIPFIKAKHISNGFVFLLFWVNFQFIVDYLISSVPWI